MTEYKITCDLFCGNSDALSVAFTDHTQLFLLIYRSGQTYISLVFGLCHQIWDAVASRTWHTVLRIHVILTLTVSAYWLGVYTSSNDTVP